MRQLNSEYLSENRKEYISTDGDEIEDEKHPNVLATPPTAQETVPTWLYLISHNSKSKYTQLSIESALREQLFFI